jgi:Fe2+ transport system protein B
VLEAQKTALGELKEQAIQAALRHEQALKDARVAAEARVAEIVEDSTNANTVLAAELEEERKSRKAAERLIDTMTTDHREYDRLVMKIDALALRKFLPCPFFCL